MSVRHSGHLSPIASISTCFLDFPTDFLSGEIHQTRLVADAAVDWDSLAGRDLPVADATGADGTMFLSH